MKQRLFCLCVAIVCVPRIAAAQNKRTHHPKEDRVGNADSTIKKPASVYYSTHYDKVRRNRR